MFDSKQFSEQLVSILLVLVIELPAFCQEAESTDSSQSASRTKIPKVDLSLDAPLFRLRPARLQAVRSPAQGQITDLQIELGERVKKDDLLMRIRNQQLETELRRALVSFHSLRERNQKMSSEDSSTASVDSLRNQLAAYRAELRELSERFRLFSIASPFTGLIDQLPVLSGEVVSSGQAVARVIESSRMQLRIPVNGRLLQPGQTIPVLLPYGRTEGTVVELIAPDASASPYHSLFQQLRIAVIAIENNTARLTDGDLAYVPLAPLALVPRSFARALDRRDPTVNVLSSDGRTTTIPIRLIGDAHNEKTVIAGAFREDDKILQSEEKNAKTDEKTTPLQGVTLFFTPTAPMTPDRFESSMPALADALPTLEPPNEDASSDSTEAITRLEPPENLEPFLLPNEYPYPLVNLEKNYSLWGILPVDRACYRTIDQFYESVVAEKQLGIRQLKDLRSISGGGSFIDYVNDVERLNEEFLIATEPLQKSRSPNNQLRILFDGLGMQLLFTQSGRQLLNLNEQQLNQLDRMRQAQRTQRDQEVRKYLDGEQSENEAARNVRQILSAWSEDLFFVLNDTQKQKLNQVGGTSGSDFNDKASAENGTGESLTANVEEEEQAKTRSRVALPEALRQGQESTLVPFLLLGGGLTLILVLLVIGYPTYRRKKRS